MPPRQTSGPQVALVPLHVSGGSHALPSDSRQTVPAGLKPSPGQSALLPVQFSATSQLPKAVPQALGRHSTDDGFKTSAGQLPSAAQVSATSQSPADGRH